MTEFISTLKNIDPDIKIAYHSDGNIYPFFPDLIEIGLDVLNPLQPACMDPAKLKKEYGKKLCFWGTIDEQYSLPFGTPEEVKKEVLARLQTIGKGGGLIIGPTHQSSSIRLLKISGHWSILLEKLRILPYNLQYQGCFM